MDGKTPASHIHWTAKVSCGFSVCTALIFLIQFTLQSLSPVMPLYQLLLPLTRPLSILASWLPLRQLLPPLMPLYLLSFIFAGIALAISSRQQWRKGRRMAIIGVILAGIILTLNGALTVYILFFWRPHLVW